MIADNRLAEQASWSPHLLAEHFRALCAVDLDFDLEATGFEVPEIDLFIQGLSPSIEDEADPADDLPPEPTFGVTSVEIRGCSASTECSVVTPFRPAFGQI